MRIATPAVPSSPARGSSDELHSAKLYLEAPTRAPMPCTNGEKRVATEETAATTAAAPLPLWRGSKPPDAAHMQVGCLEDERRLGHDGRAASRPARRLSELRLGGAWLERGWLERGWLEQE